MKKCNCCFNAYYWVENGEQFADCNNWVTLSDKEYTQIETLMETYSIFDENGIIAEKCSKFIDNSRQTKRGKMIKEQLQELIGLIYDLNNLDDDKDWFMSFSGHVDSVGVHYSVQRKCTCCEDIKHDSVYLDHCCQFEQLGGLIETLKERLKNGNN